MVMRRSLMMLVSIITVTLTKRMMIVHGINQHIVMMLSRNIIMMMTMNTTSRNQRVNIVTFDENDPQIIKDHQEVLVYLDRIVVPMIALVTTTMVVVFGAACVMEVIVAIAAVAVVV